MRWDGQNYTRNRAYGFRNALPIDRHFDGSKISSNYMIPVRVKQCRHYEKDGRQYYDPEGAPAVPTTGHSLTNLAYGAPKLRHQHGNLWESTMMFLGYDGQVYTRSNRNLVIQEHAEIFRAEITVQTHGGKDLFYVKPIFVLPLGVREAYGVETVTSHGLSFVVDNLELAKKLRKAMEDGKCYEDPYLIVFQGRNGYEVRGRVRGFKIKRDPDISIEEQISTFAH